MKRRLAIQRSNHGPWRADYVTKTSAALATVGPLTDDGSRSRAPNRGARYGMARVRFTRRRHPYADTAAYQTKALKPLAIDIAAMSCSGGFSLRVGHTCVPGRMDGP
ncbi:hypothetical protein EVAR_44701_1 [Eumeta japonica]|uniref:Uncharacterized protein n=1 Tax=Eumeta variegata TaxID=151549 RepID=A0A4C1XG38_EUMVA|nr:hypothetical protein EVAR_44701_1 [Eumeta japonica]